MKVRKPCIAVDAMGGDHGPSVVVPGAVDAARSGKLGLILVGDEKAVNGELAKVNTSGLDIEVVHASQVVEMGDKPTDVLRRKKDSSIHVAFRLAKEGRADGVVSAGNTGATLACGIFIMGRIKGVERPALASILPTEKSPVILIDVGANVDAKAHHLFQFGLMADSLARSVLGKNHPSVGLMSIGEEEGKGNVQVKEAFEMFRHSSLNFVGNVEGRDIFKGERDIVVCDGFVGNVCLKLAEGLATSIGRMLKRELKNDVFSILGTVLSAAGFRRFKRLMDYAEYGGAPILGLQGIAIVCHGASNPKAIMNAVDMAATFIRNKANDHLAAMLSENQDLSKYGRGKSGRAAAAS